MAVWASSRTFRIHSSSRCSSRSTDRMCFNTVLGITMAISSKCSSRIWLETKCTSTINRELKSETGKPKEALALAEAESASSYLQTLKANFPKTSRNRILGESVPSMSKDSEANQISKAITANHFSSSITINMVQHTTSSTTKKHFHFQDSQVKSNQNHPSNTFIKETPSKNLSQCLKLLTQITIKFSTHFLDKSNQPTS